MGGRSAVRLGEQDVLDAGHALQTPRHLLCADVHGLGRERCLAVQPVGAEQGIELGEERCDGGGVIEGGFADNDVAHRPPRMR